MSEVIRPNISKTVAGKILHIDGDMRYSKKALDYYKKIGLQNAVVKNVSEKRQQYVVEDLLLELLRLSKKSVNSLIGARISLYPCFFAICLIFFNFLLSSCGYNKFSIFQKSFNIAILTLKLKLLNLGKI